jgi:oxygen-independent coproporphyrinogen III oxidase
MYKETALYIHIPFCDHKCIYCDFYSIITTDNIDPFFNSLIKEFDYYSKIYSEGRVFTSVYFGGGTPSLMTTSYIKKIINVLNEKFNILPDAEITLETNPGTVDYEKLKRFREAGINRISIGIQSFHDDELKFLTRIHDSETAVRTVNDAANAGYKNISIDLIFNLPGQTKEKWRSNLSKALDLPIKHISAYSLILERGTILNKMVLDGKVKIQDSDYDADLYEITIDYLTANGFYQYEVSNFAKPDFECRHNNAYWHYKDYLSFGTSAHSFVDGKRWWNFSSLKRYISEIEKNGHAQANHEFITKEEMFDEFVMLALRSSGINLKDFKIRFGEKWLSDKSVYFNSLAEGNFVEIDNDLIRLTKKGYAVCDEILKKILS